MIVIKDISYDEIEVIRALWEKNRLYHENISEYFKEIYSNIDFEKKIGAFSKLNKNMIKITIAEDNDKCIGYCISTIDDEKGELQTFHIDKDSRGNGVGKEIGLRHINWMKEMKCSQIGVNVSPENINTIEFYKKIGFLPNSLYMQLK